MLSHSGAALPSAAQCICSATELCAAHNRVLPSKLTGVMATMCAPEQPLEVSVVQHGPCHQSGVHCAMMKNTKTRGKARHGAVTSGQDCKCAAAAGEVCIGVQPNKRQQQVVTTATAAGICSHRCSVAWPLLQGQPWWRPQAVKRQLVIARGASERGGKVLCCKPQGTP